MAGRTERLGGGVINTYLDSDDEDANSCRADVGSRAVVWGYRFEAVVKSRRE